MGRRGGQTCLDLAERHRDSQTDRGIDVHTEHTYAHTCIHACLHACIHAYIYTYKRIHIYTYSSRYTYLLTCRCVNTGIRLIICSYALSYLYVCTYIHMHVSPYRGLPRDFKFSCSHTRRTWSSKHYIEA